jgi:hypothetical protein
MRLPVLSKAALRCYLTLALLSLDSPTPDKPLPKARHRTKQASALNFDIRQSLYHLIGVDLTQIHGQGPYLALRMISECGTDMSKWPTAKHFSSWLTLSPGSTITGGKALSAHTRKSNNRIVAHLRLAATTLGRTNTALGAFYRRLSARIGKAKAVTATARKIAVLFYNAMRYGMDYQDPGADQYEQQYRESGPLRICAVRLLILALLLCLVLHILPGGNCCKAQLANLIRSARKGHKNVM